MNRDNQWEKAVRDTFDEIKKNREIIKTEIAGVLFIVHPDVFPAHIFYESQWFAEKVAEIVGEKSLLEIGTGTGVIAVFAALGGAEVTVVDINPSAITNARENFASNEVEVASFVGHLYDPLPIGSRFDYIFWNHPFNKGNTEETDVLLKSVFDFEYRDLEEYIAKAHEHLTDSGQLLLGTGSIANIDAIEEIALRYKYQLKLIEVVESPSEVDVTSPNDYRIYVFTSKKVASAH
jgi:methylase of polypeptide subunit release factors